MLEKLKLFWQRWGRLTPEHSLYDRSLLLCYFLLLGISFIAISSASITGTKRYIPMSFEFMQKDAIYIVITLIVMAMVTQIPVQVWQRFHMPLLLASFGLLIFVLIKGSAMNGSARWINLGGVNFQPSELAKLAIISYLAGFFVRKQDVIKTSRASGLHPALVVGLFAVLLLNQPDLGSLLIIGGIFVLMLFISGAKLAQFGLIILVAAIGIVIAILISPYRLERVNSFGNPFADIDNSGYQVANSLMALGQGKISGVGLGNSIQKLGFLPERHTDFILSVIGEEFGWLGLMVLSLITIFLVLRILNISKQSLLLEKRYPGFFAFGVAVWIFGQAFANLLVITGLVPPKGLTFPFISFGGSSLIMMSVAFAIVLRIDYENRLEKIGSAMPKNT